MNLDQSGQTSTELILLLSGIIIIVLIIMNLYQNYVIDLTGDIENNELDNLTNQIDNLFKK
ncbi:MAG: class III signal peptide-containing protein [Methanosphaera stadtmanae]|nr:class III signal peptide-containing protein [Methanosphaera stadtmanae]